MFLRSVFLCLCLFVCVFFCLLFILRVVSLTLRPLLSAAFCDGIQPHRLSRRHPWHSPHAWSTCGGTNCAERRSTHTSHSRNQTAQAFEHSFFRSKKCFFYFGVLEFLERVDEKREKKNTMQLNFKIFN